MAQIVALMMVAQVVGGGVSAVKVGKFLSMGACRGAAEHAVPIDGAAKTQISFVCVPLSPVSDTDNRR